MKNSTIFFITALIVGVAGYFSGYDRAFTGVAVLFVLWKLEEINETLKGE